MKRKLIIGLVCVLVLIVAYIGYKEYLLYKYKVSINDELKEQLENSNQIITITTNSNFNNDDMMEFKNLVYKKPEGDFIYNEDKSSNESSNPYNSYYLDGVDTENLTALFRVGITYNVYEMLTLSDSDITTFGFSFKGTNKKRILEKYSLENDFDIYKYIVNHYNDKMNILSSKNKIKLNYLIKMYANVAIPVSKISLIDGDLKGYMYTIKDGLIYEVHIIHDGTNYAFGFFNGKSNNYFNLGDVENFLSNVHFKD